MERKLPWISEHFLLNRQFERVDDITEEAGEEEEDEEIETFKSKKTFISVTNFEHEHGHEHEPTRRCSPNA